MSSKIKVRLIGDNPVIVFGQLMLPGETRELHPVQAEQLDEWYPGRFERIGIPLDEVSDGGGDGSGVAGKPAGKRRSSKGRRSK